MKVLTGPRLDSSSDSRIADLCHRLAGEAGVVVALADLGVRNLSRPLSAAEVHRIRSALRSEPGIVGYVCTGVLFPRPTGPTGGKPGPDLIAVSDHVNLTWRSPLLGPNDDSAGPRFPGLAGVYAPEHVLALAGEEDGMIVAPGVVAGVPDDRALGDYETGVAAQLAWVAASSELVAPVIIAAHLGLRVAAAVVTG